MSAGMSAARSRVTAFSRDLLWAGVRSASGSTARCVAWSWSVMAPRPNGVPATVLGAATRAAARTARRRRRIGTRCPGDAGPRATYPVAPGHAGAPGGRSPRPPAPPAVLLGGDVRVGLLADRQE